MVEPPILNATVLAVFPFAEDRTSLQSILGHANWKLQFACTLLETQTALRASSLGAVISEGCLPDGHCWKDILQEMQTLEYAPPLIVTDRLADERLWAEVLNMGAYDLLMKPLDGNEVLRVLSMACRRGESEHGMATLRKPRNSAEHGRAPRTKRAASGGR